MKFLTVNKTIVDLPTNSFLIVLTDAGLITPYVEPAAQRKPNAVWSMGHGATSEEMRISVSCSTCRTSDVIFSHPEKYKFWHCGIGEPVPPDILAKWKEVVGK